MLSIRAFAKVNLVLAVGPPEPPGSPRPGWHPIASWMSCIDLADDLTLARLPAGAVSTHAIGWAADAPRPTPIDWPIENDLAVRAHRLLESRAGRALPVELRLTKRIPVGGGLGGGSSDAAAVLTGLNELFELGISTAELQRLGAALGSDVAFFLDEEDPPRPAIVTGFGDRIGRVDRLASDILLLVPPFSCSTKDVYSAFDTTLPADREFVERFSVIGPVSLPLSDEPVRQCHSEALRRGFIEAGKLFNSLTPAAQRVEPRLTVAMNAVTLAAREITCMTGSGSCCFIIGPAGRLNEAHRRVIESLRDSAPALRDVCCVRTRLV